MKIYKNANGKKTTKKIGVEYEIMNTVPRIATNVTRNEPTAAGRFESTTSISFENLFIIRPIGVVSKKDIESLKMLFSKFS